MPMISTNELSSIVIGLVCIPITPLAFATKTISSISVIVDVIVVMPGPSTKLTFPIAPNPSVPLLSKTNLSPTL